MPLNRREFLVRSAVAASLAALPRRQLDRLGPEAAGRFAIAEIERMRPAARGQLRVAALHS